MENDITLVLASQLYITGTAAVIESVQKKSTSYCASYIQLKITVVGNNKSPEQKKYIVFVSERIE